MRSMDVAVGLLLVVAWTAGPGLGMQGVPADDAGPPAWDEHLRGPLPRWREGDRPPLDPERSLLPYAVHRGPSSWVPTSGVIASPAEYAPVAGVLYRYSTAAWADVVTDCVMELTKDAGHDEIAYVIVSSTSQQSSATAQFAAAGADLGKVQFIIMPTNSIWIRDYGPHFIFQSGTRAIVDSHYYPTRTLDNFIPTLLADDRFLIPSYDIGLYYSGGNFQPGTARTGYMTSLVHLDNPGFGDAFIGELMDGYQGIDTLHIFPQLPWSVDGTGHIDMWMYLVDEDTVIISEFLPGSNAQAIEITDNAADYMLAAGYEVFRVPALNAYHPNTSSCHYTYTNAYRVNDRIFIPQYREGGSEHAARDTQALAVFQAAAPDATIVPIDSYGIIWAAGAIHCIIMQVPRYVEAMPAAHVVAPDGGELLVRGNTCDLQWSAVDDQQVTAIDLSYSTDGGVTFPHPIAENEPNDGHFEWVIPDTLTSQAVVQAVVEDSDGNSTAAVSESTFEMSAATQTVYDFSSGAGVDKWAWGYQSLSWSSVQGVQYPATAELSAADYAALAAADATGGDSDVNRYRSPYPSSGRESTHVFEFTIGEDPATIVDLHIAWEGYGDDCTQMELYVWDHVAGDWCDGAGRFGENRFVDNFAGNRDAELEGHVRQDVDRLIDGHGVLTVLLYAERSGDRSFHDHVAVTVSSGTPCPGDLTGDGVINVFDLLMLLGNFGNTPPADTTGDLTGPSPGDPPDGVVNVFDLLALLEVFGQTCPTP